MAAKAENTQADGFCDTCENFVPSPSRGKDYSGKCFYDPTPVSVPMGDMHWCRKGYKKGKQRSARASSSNPEGIVPQAAPVKDNLTTNKPKIPELI